MNFVKFQKTFKTDRSLGPSPEKQKQKKNNKTKKKKIPLFVNIIPRSF
jgi:hypothetical protein